MTQEKMPPLRARMKEDRGIRGMAVTSQKAHSRALKDFTACLGRSPDTANPDELRASEVTDLKLRDIDSDTMLIHVVRGKDRGTRRSCGGLDQVHSPAHRVYQLQEPALPEVPGAGGRLSLGCQQAWLLAPCACLVAMPKAARRTLNHSYPE